MSSPVGAAADPVHLSAAELINEHVNLIAQGDVARWRSSIFAVNGVWELPYGASCGMPTKLIGLDAMVEAVELFINGCEGMQFTRPKVTVVSPSEAFAEYEVTCKVLATQKTYHQNYIVYAKAEQGRLILLREYFDSVRLMEAFQYTRTMHSPIN
ncbi:unnamed protein product [Didymodactylos carnosus]|uniref:SnoaL-like domain-containing protein n=1 Tax=Didymodactylos carnosus TaxID=1234261 RepID=A0A815JZX2_9BILA|nr:unnamed protein product [Didymodactylos carnosus]CAF4281629.1 unnamed protein product [Didymodactylos carnosus]